MSSRSDQAAVTGAAATPVELGMRTGPLGRAVRLLGTLFMGAGLYVMLDVGVTDFRRLPELGNPGPWILTVVVAILMTDLVLRFLPLPSKRVRLAVLGVITAIVVLAAVVTVASEGSLWGPPLSDLVWVIDVVYLTYSTASLALALLLGTPGCENMAWAELRARLRGDRDRMTGRWCVGGLHVVDNWELGRRAQRPA